MPDGYYKGVNTLAPTDGIKDPQVRAFCDSLANVWQLRNGNSGSDDKQRFITKEEWDFLAKNPNIRAIAGVGQPGSSTLEPGPGSSGGGGGTVPIPPGLQNLLDFLASGITLVDFTKVYRTSNELFANYFALTTEMRNALTGINETIAGLQNDITQINTITHDSTSASAQSLYALKEQVNDPVTGLPAASAAIIQINNVSVSSGSANARQTAALVATVNDPNTGNIANTAAIIQINTVTATSQSANARQLYGLNAQTNDPNTGLPKATADIAQINTVTTTSGSAIARTVAGMSAQVNGNLAMINEINNVAANSTSASARQLSGVIAYSGLKARVFAGPTAPTSNATYTLLPGDLWIDTTNQNKLMIWNATGTAWVDASDARLANASAGITQETTARTSSDTALATQLNLFWAQLGGTQALVTGSTSVIANPNAGTAHKFDQVYSALKDSNGNIYQAASQQDFLTYVNADTATANASWSLMVQAQVGGVKAVAGMKLTADVTNGTIPTSNMVVLVDNFAIFNSATGTTPPFLVSGGKVRMNIVNIADRIQSDVYTPRTTGWIIRKDGSAEFNGVSFFGSMYSGSKLIDQDSLLQIPTTAIAAWSQAAAINNPSDSFIFTNTANAMFGPNAHNAAGLYQRIRGDHGIGLATTVQFIGVADHYVTIWMRYSSGAWQALATTATPSSGYGAVTCGWVGVLNCALGGYYEFGVSPTTASFGFFNSGARNLSDFTFTVTMVNL
jgi:hypothetical protein